MDSLEERVNSVFFDDQYSGESNSCSKYESDGDESDDPEERTLYWESQYSLLQEVLERYRMTGSKLRQEIIKSIEKARETEYLCRCSNPKPSDACNNCFRRTLVNLLQDKGIKASLTTSKWRDTKKFPRGTHEYIEVIGSTGSRKKQVPYIVEVEFRDQFEIAKACNEYRKLLNQLPEYYIGKADYLTAIVRLVCDAAKRSMKEKNIHMGPWRKTSFVLMKWSASINKSSESSRQPHDSCVQFSAAPAVVVT